jgi:dTDP-4-dehydrorhamnose 3,5-epimerase
VHGTSISGLLHVELDVHGDSRGWFKESWQREKLVAAGVPDLSIVQHNVSYNERAGVTRGIHAEPWNKWISPAAGRVFSAVVELRPGPGFGTVETFELGVADALYVPKGCGNSFCTLDPHTAYSYLVDDHWSPDAVYVNVNLFDPTLAIAWPMPRGEMTISDKDLAHPPLVSP